MRSIILCWLGAIARACRTCGRFTFRVAGTILLAVSTSSSFAGTPNATFTAIDGVYAYHLSDDGTTVAGMTQTSTLRACRWTFDTGLELLNALDGGSHQFANGISGHGDIIVGINDVGGYQWTTSSGFELLDLPVTLFPSGVSDDGRFLIGSTKHGLPALFDTLNSNYVVPYLPSGKAFGFVDNLSGDGRFVVGTLGFDNPADWKARASEAFRWDAVQGTIGLGDLSGGPFFSRAFDLSADASVIVGESISAESAANTPEENDSEGFYWTQATGMVGIGDLPGGPFYSAADAVTAAGSIIVGTSISDRAQEAIIYDFKHGMRPLQDVLIDRYGLGDELIGWQLERAFDVSADGRTIVGMARDPQGAYTAWIVTVPEPSSLALLTFALVCAVTSRRWQR